MHRFPSIARTARLCGLVVAFAAAAAHLSAAPFGTLSSSSIPVHTIRVTPKISTVTVGTTVTFTVYAGYTNGAVADVTNDPDTTYMVTHGDGIVSGNSYTAIHAEAAVITVSYTSGGVTRYADAYITETLPHGRIVSSTFTPYQSSVNVTTPVTFKFTVTYGDSTTVDVSTSPNTKYTLVHGVGTLTGNTYISTRAEAAAITAVYTEPTTAQTINKAGYIVENYPHGRIVSSVLTPGSTTAVSPTAVTFSFKVTYADSTVVDVSTSSHTKYTVLHGGGTLTSNSYSSAVAEVAVISAVYTDPTTGQVDAKASYITEIPAFALKAITINPTRPTVSVGSTVIWTVTAHYTDGTSADVTSSSIATAKYSGYGTTSANTYTPTKAGANLPVVLSYTQGGVTATTTSYVTAH